MRDPRALALPLVWLGCTAPAEDLHFGRGAATAAVTPVEEISVPPPPFTEGVFPCSDCHANLEPDPTPRALEEHTAIRLDHGPRERWCFECHEAGDRDVLHLAGGKTLPFSESFRLCGQCHGDKYRDWRRGVHGKRTGSYSGKKMYLLCAHCHDPHRPAFAPLEPMPPPRRPEEIR
jgi:hypothetical protein